MAKMSRFFLPILKIAIINHDYQSRLFIMSGKTYFYCTFYFKQTVCELSVQFWVAPWWLRKCLIPFPTEPDF